VTCYCSLEHAGESSIAVKIETWPEGREELQAEKVTEGVFTYVAIGDDGKAPDLSDHGNV
jgi:acyl-CoA thioesterase YciA